MIPFVIALALFLVPPAADAQPAGKVAKIGYLSWASPGPVYNQRLEELRQGLRERGHVEGQTFTLEVRLAEGKLERLPRLAAELVTLKVDVIVTHGPQGVRAAKEATSAIPIVMARMDDVDAHGLVASLGRPGGNITGVSFQTGELSGKWLQLLKEVLPRVAHVAILWDTTGTANQAQAAQAAARSLKLSAQVLDVRGPADFDAAFETARRQKADGLVILGSPALTVHAPRLADLASKIRMPAIYYHRRFAEAGGLLAYGPKESDFSWRRAAVFVDKILKGAKPADLPIEQPTTFELVINGKTAKAFGLTIPQALLLRADHVIQ
jgi:putative ABC transport system substrate-binding protein